MRTIRLVLTCAVAALMAIAATPYGSAAQWNPETRLAGLQVAASSSPCTPAGHCAPPDSQQAFREFFAYVLQIPDNVLRQGDAATKEWINRHPRPSSGSQRPFMSPRPSTANPYRCTLAVAALLVTTGLPALKILKIKRAIEGLGGVADAARLVVGATSAAEKSQAVLTALGSLISELLGIAAVQQFCFG